MIRDNLNHYPSSLSYHEAIDRIKRSGGVACCYIGDNVGKVAFKGSDGEIKILIPSKGREISGDNKNHELWSFVEDLDSDNPINGAIMNMLFDLYCEYYNYLQENNVDLFYKDK